MGKEMVSVSIVGPAKTGKTSLLAAVQERLSLGDFEIDGHTFSARPVSGLHGEPQLDALALRRLKDARDALVRDEDALSSDGWYSYQASVESTAGDRRELALLDSIGEALWPLEGPTVDGARVSSPSLLRRYDELGIAHAEHVLVVLLNEPPRPNPEWKPRGEGIPEEVGAYLRGVTFARVVLLVAGAELVGEEPGDTERRLAEQNRGANSAHGLGELPEVEKQFAQDVIAVLRKTSDLSATDFSLFRCSARGWGEGGGSHWCPIEVLRPFIWAAGFPNEEIGVER